MKFQKKVVSLYIRPIASGIFHEIFVLRQEERKKERIQFPSTRFCLVRKTRKVFGCAKPSATARDDKVSSIKRASSGLLWRVLSTTAKFPRTGFNNTISFGKVARQRGRSRVRTMRKLICIDTLEINVARVVTIASKSF